MSDAKRIKQNLQKILDHSPEFTQAVGVVIDSFAGKIESGVISGAELHRAARTLPDTFLENLPVEVCPSCGGEGCDRTAAAFSGI